MKNLIRHLAVWHSDEPGTITLRNVCGSPKQSAYNMEDATCLDCLRRYNETHPGPDIRRRIANLTLDSQLEEILNG